MIYYNAPGRETRGQAARTARDEEQEGTVLSQAQSNKNINHLQTTSFSKVQSGQMGPDPGSFEHSSGI